MDHSFSSKERASFLQLPSSVILETKKIKSFTVSIVSPIYLPSSDKTAHEFGWTPGIDDGQGGLAYCSPWGPRVGHDWATKLNWTELMELDAMILVFWMLSFKPTFSLSSLTFIKWLFSFSLLSAIRVVSSAYLRLLIFLPAILIPTCASSDLAFHMMYSAHKLNKQGDNI